MLDTTTPSIGRSQKSTKSIGRHSVVRMSSGEDYIKALVNGRVSFDKVPSGIIASQDFILGALKICPEEAIKVMNSWDQSTMNTFIERYDELPEAMLGKLFSCGLDPKNLPKDIKLSLPFLRVALNTNPKRLVAESLNREDIQSVRLALRELRDEEIKTLWENGLSTNKLPREIAAQEKFGEWAIDVDPARFEKETLNLVNSRVRAIKGKELTARQSR